jgi:protein-tyrosine phosphatase
MSFNSLSLNSCYAILGFRKENVPYRSKGYSQTDLDRANVALTLILIMSTSNHQRAARPQRPERMTPIPNSYWVRPGQLLAGEYPMDWDDRMSRQKLRRLLEAGVTFFLDLTEAGEYGLKPYTSPLREEAATMGRSVKHQRIPIRDRGTPPQEEMVHILDTLDIALAEGQAVYVHCYGGIGRTGTVIGCYLVRHGMGGAEALEEIARLRQATPSGWVTSPETKAQRQMVRDWSPGR